MKQTLVCFFYSTLRHPSWLVYRGAVFRGNPVSFTKPVLNVVFFCCSQRLGYFRFRYEQSVVDHIASVSGKKIPARFYVRRPLSDLPRVVKCV